MVNYSQATVISRGGFAPNVQYNASARMPTQPIPELKQPDSKFNIDLSGLGRGLAQAAYQEKLAQKEEMKLAKEQHEQMLKTNFAKEANLIQMGVDQGAFSAEVGQRKSRELSDKYLSYGMDPDELFPIYENAVSSDVRDIFANRRKNIEDAKNAVDSTIYKDVLTKVPETSNWSYEEVVNYGRHNQMIADEMELAMMYGVGEEEAANKFIDVQAGSTALNMRQDFMNGTLNGPEAKLQMYQSVSMALAKKNPNMSASMVKDLTTRRLPGVNSYIDMMASANEAERKLIADRYDTLIKTDKMKYYQYLDPEDRAKYLYGLLDKTNPYDAGIFGPKATQIGTQEVTSADGKTTTSQPTYLVRDLSGNEMVVTAASTEEAIEIMSNTSKNVYSEGSGAIPYIEQALPQSYNNPNISPQGVQNMSPEDATTLENNRKAFDAVAGSVNNRNTLKNNPDAIRYIDNQLSITAGLSAYNNVPGVKEIVQDNDNYVRALKGNDVMLENTRINSEGYLVAATDVQGALGTMQQYLTGAKYRGNLDQINNNLSRISPMHRKNVAKLHLESYGLSVKDYDPTVDGDMTSAPVFGETVAQKTYEVAGKAWEYGDKGIRKFDEKVYMPLQTKLQEVLEEYIVPQIDAAEKALPAVVKDWQGGEGTYKDYLMNNVKEAFDNVARYASTVVSNYRALQVGKDASGLDGIVNKPEEPVESGDNLNDFLSTIKYYADPSHYETPEIRLDKVIATEKPTTMFGKAADAITDDKRVVKMAEGVGKIRESAMKWAEEKLSNVVEKGKEVAEDVIDAIDIIGRTAAYNELAPKLGMSKALEVSLGDNKGKITRLEKGWTILQSVLGKTTEKAATKTKDIILGTAKAIYDYLTEEVSVKDDEEFESYFERLVNTKLYDLPEQYEIRYEEDPSKIELFPQVKSIKKNR